MLDPHWSFLQHIQSNKLQTNFISEAACLILCKSLRIKFPFLQQNIAPQLIEMIEAYHKGLDNVDDDKDDEKDEPADNTAKDDGGDTKIEVRIINCCLPHDKFC